MSDTLYSNFFVNLHDLSPLSTPTLSHSSSDSLVSSPNEEPYLPEPAIPFPDPLTTPLRSRRIARGQAAKAKVTLPMQSEGSSHKGRHLRRGEQLRRNAACSQCRKRRTRCDAARPHCGSCVRHHAYLQKTQPAAYPAESTVMCCYDDESEPVLPLGHTARRGVGSDTPTQTASAPNGRRQSMPVMPSHARPSRKSSKQSSVTPSTTASASERSSTAEPHVHEPSVHDLYSRVAELQSQLLQQQLAAPSSSPTLHPRLPFADDGFPGTLQNDLTSSALSNPPTSEQWTADEPLDPLVGYITGLSQDAASHPGSAPIYTSPLPFSSPQASSVANNSWMSLADGISMSSTMPAWGQPLISPMSSIHTPRTTFTGMSLPPQAAMMSTAHAFGFSADASIPSASTSSSHGPDFANEQLFPNSDALYRQAIASMQPHSLQELLSMNRMLQQQQQGQGTAVMEGGQQIPVMALQLPAGVQPDQPPMADWWATAYLEQEFRERTDRTDNNEYRHSI